MRCLLIGSTLLATSFYTQSQCTFLDKLSHYQQDVAYQAYMAGEAHDLGLTSVAIAWQESKLGLYKIRLGKGFDQSYGVGHSAIKWKTKGMTAMERGIWAQNMIEHDAMSISVMVDDIIYWQRAKKDWKKGVMAYNAGYGSNTNYRDEVVSTVKKLKGCEF